MEYTLSMQELKRKEKEQLEKDKIIQSAILGWFKSLPSETTIQWGEDCLNREADFASGYADIQIPELEQELKLGWVWTVIVPGAEDFSEEYIFNIFLEPTKEAIIAYKDDEQKTYARYLSEPYTLEQIQETEMLETQGWKVWKKLGWGAQDVSEKLSKYIAENTGRRDLSFVFEEEIMSKMVQKVAAMKLGEKPFNEGLQVSDNVKIRPEAIKDFEELSPEERGEMVDLLQNESNIEFGE